MSQMEKSTMSTPARPNLPAGLSALCDDTIRPDLSVIEKAHLLLSQFYDEVDADKNGDLDIEELGKAVKRLEAAGGKPK